MQTLLIVFVTETVETTSKVTDKTPIETITETVTETAINHVDIAEASSGAIGEHEAAFCKRTQAKLDLYAHPQDSQPQLGVHYPKRGVSRPRVVLHHPEIRFLCRKPRTSRHRRGRPPAEPEPHRLRPNPPNPSHHNRDSSAGGRKLGTPVRPAQIFITIGPADGITRITQFLTLLFV